MAFSDWDPYVELLERMWDAADGWRSAATFAQLEEQIRWACPELVGGDSASSVGEYGFAALADALAEDDPDQDRVAARIKFAALSRPAVDHGLSAEWSGHFVSETAEGHLVYSDQRFAGPDAWRPVDSAVAEDAVDEESRLSRDEASGLLYDAERWYLEDGVTVVEPVLDNPGYARDRDGNLYHRGEPADPATMLFDRESGRWRRATDSGEYEYHHEADQVWERPGEHGLWLRLHDGTGQWLPYDAPSQTWLYGDQWLAGDLVGSAPSLPEEETTRLTRERDTALRAAIADVRAAGLGPEAVTDAEIEALFDQRVLAALSGEAR
ncbi:hypothetical protein [Streptacidiphilus melanogenes]|uniref:hypothetical protein n=1 Tax=Streptacidiphilus melanogenes TaxID=411235 RepID=UPI0005AB3601|nr:hypothetical protein [Streptacidiphilus melanogenes]